MHDKDRDDDAALAPGDGQRRARTNFHCSAAELLTSHRRPVVINSQATAASCPSSRSSSSSSSSAFSSPPPAIRHGRQPPLRHGSALRQPRPSIVPILILIRACPFTRNPLEPLAHTHSTGGAHIAPTTRLHITARPPLLQHPGHAPRPPRRPQARRRVRSPRPLPCPCTASC
jgi:hypothetical protein